MALYINEFSLLKWGQKQIIVQDMFLDIQLGPVVHSIVSLTTSLRRQLVKYMPTKLSNTLLFFVGKM